VALFFGFLFVGQALYDSTPCTSLQWLRQKYQLRLLFNMFIILISLVCFCAQKTLSNSSKIQAAETQYGR